MHREVGCSMGIVLLLASPLTADQPIRIDHDAVACVQADRFPRFFARFEPAGSVARARLAFRPGGGLHWYSVPMTRDGFNFVGVLPKPKKSLPKLDYYILAVDQDLREARTEEFSAEVVSGPVGCEGGKLVAASLAAAKAVLVSPPDAVANLAMVPAGFSADGVVAGSSASAAARPWTPAGGEAGGAGAAAPGAAAPASGAAAAAAGAGGISTAALVVGAVAVAGAGTALAVTGVGSQEASPGDPNGDNRAPSVGILIEPTGQMIVSVTVVRLTATGGDPDGDAISHDWNFGDGLTGTGSTVGHVFGNQGTFQVVVTARDARGATASASAQVTVRSLAGTWHLWGVYATDGVQNGAELVLRHPTMPDDIYRHSCQLVSPRSLAACVMSVTNPPVGVDHTCGTGGVGSVDEALNRIEIAYPGRSCPGDVTRVWTR